jgi:hypothetical protein
VITVCWLRSPSASEEEDEEEAIPHVRFGSTLSR